MSQETCLEIKKALPWLETGLIIMLILNPCLTNTVGRDFFILKEEPECRTSWMEQWLSDISS
jgi:hypothetical protein